ncbi:MAG: hypothetical protein R3B72_47685 [Polyangiaceae bacterium]
MIIECKHCGAPLDVEVNASLARCKYCGTTQRVRTARTQYPQTPPNWSPPQQWTPPAHVPARSVPLRYDAGKKVVTFVVAMILVTTIVPFLVIGGVVIFIIMAAPSPRATPSPPPPPPRSMPVTGPRAGGADICAKAMKCCEVLGQDNASCKGITEVPNPTVCQQLYDGLKDAARQLGTPCD